MTTPERKVQPLSWGLLRALQPRARLILVISAGEPGLTPKQVANVLYDYSDPGAQKAMTTYAQTAYELLGVKNWKEFQERANDVRELLLREPEEAKRFIAGTTIRVGTRDDIQFKITDEVHRLVASRGIVDQPPVDQPRAFEAAPLRERQEVDEQSAKPGNSGGVRGLLVAGRDHKTLLAAAGVLLVFVSVLAGVLALLPPDAKPPAGLNGRVTDGAGRALAGIYVYACPEPAALCGYAVTNSDGMYGILVSEGQFRIQFGRTPDGQHPDGFYSTRGFVREQAQASLILYQGHGLTGLDVQLK